MSYIAANNARSKLAASLGGLVSDVTVTIGGGDVSKFPAINNAGATPAEYSYLTLQDATGHVEHMKISRHDTASASITVVRGTAAGIVGTTDANVRAWLIGDSAAITLNAQIVNDAFSGPVVSAAAAAASASAASGSASAAASSASAAAGSAASAVAAVAALLPAGAVQMFAMAGAPAGWLVADGSSVLRASYAALFSAIGTTYGSVDGTHFNLPDLRGQFVRGLDSGRGVDPARTLSNTPQAGANAPHSHTINISDPTHTHSVYDPGHTHGGTVFTAGSTVIPYSFPGYDLGAIAVAYTGISLYSAATGITASSVSSGTEARPTNVAMVFCIKT